MEGMSVRGTSRGRPSTLSVALSSLAMGFCFGGCAESAGATEEERSGQVASAGGESGAAPSHHPAGTTTAESNPFVVPDDASDALKQAEWLREEQSRAYRMLELQIEQRSATCEEARSTGAEICDISDRVCAQADIDRAAANRCDDSMERCGAARQLVSAACAS